MTDGAFGAYSCCWILATNDFYLAISMGKNQWGCGKRSRSVSKVVICKLITKPPKNTTITPQIFFVNEPAQSWETWHKRFGHTSYSRLQHMLDNNLVEGFSVDTWTHKPDCIACTESKQTVKPFGKSTKRKTESVWGKYSITSINGNNYYILFVDDSEKFSTTEFLKQKAEAAQKVKEYLTYLKTQDKKPRWSMLIEEKNWLMKT